MTAGPAIKKAEMTKLWGSPRQPASEQRAFGGAALEERGRRGERGGCSGAVEAEWGGEIKMDA